MEWSIVSKAADRLSRDRRETLSSSRAERTNDLEKGRLGAVTGTVSWLMTTE